MSKHIVRFLLLTFLFLLIGWGTCLLFSLNGIALSDHFLLYIPFLLGGFSPTIASFLVRPREQSFRQWLKTVFDFRHNVFSYFLTVLFAAAFFAVMCPVSGYDRGAPLFTVVFMIPAMLFGGGLEETGWRGFLQPELERKLGYTISTLIVALIWWLWHSPLFLIRGAGQYGSDFLAFGINVLGLSFALSAVKRVTGSTWLCVLLHCIINSLHSVFIVHTTRWGSLAASAVLILIAYFTLPVQKKTQCFR